jgi:hypothetical protein
MKKLILLLLLLLSIQTIYSQNEEPKYFIGLSYGKSFPLGDFKDNDVDLNSFGKNSGFANTGTKFDFNAGYHIKKNYGAAAVIRYQSFSTDANSFAVELNNISPSVDYKVDSKNWQFTSAYVGMFYVFPITKRISILPKGLIGFMYGTSPEINVDATNQGNTRVISIESGNSFGFAYEIGIGLKSKLGKHFALMPSFNLSNGFLSFKNNKTVYTPEGGTSTTYTRTYNPSLLTFNIGLAFAYLF